MPQFWKFRIFFCLRPFNNADCTGFQQDVDVADTVNAIDRCCANVKRAEGEVVQPRPRPGGVVLTVGGLPLRRLLPHFFSEQIPSTFDSVPGAFHPGSSLRSSDVLGAVLQTSLNFSIVNTFVYPRVPSEHPYSPRVGFHVFRGGGVSTTVAAGKYLALLSCIITSVLSTCLPHTDSGCEKERRILAGPR